ncbi:hypothetical protein MXD95_008385 [Frankia sp. AiPa1]|nr:hypothetical protein [Frankia sp. AiPa1]
MLEVEAARERLPPAVHVGRGGTGGRAPQPQRLRAPVTGQPIDDEAEQGAFQDRRWPT